MAAYTLYAYWYTWVDVLEFKGLCLYVNKKRNPLTLNLPWGQGHKVPMRPCTSLLISALGTAISGDRGVTGSPLVWQGFQLGVINVTLGSMAVSPLPSTLNSWSQKKRWKPAQPAVAFHPLHSSCEPGTCLPTKRQLCCCLCSQFPSGRWLGVSSPSALVAGWRGAGRQPFSALPAAHVVMVRTSRDSMFYFLSILQGIMRVARQAPKIASFGGICHSRVNEMGSYIIKG